MFAVRSYALYVYVGVLRTGNRQNLTKYLMSLVHRHVEARGGCAANGAGAELSLARRPWLPGTASVDSIKSFLHNTPQSYQRPADLSNGDWAAGTLRVASPRAPVARLLWRLARGASPWRLGAFMGRNGYAHTHTHTLSYIHSRLFWLSVCFSDSLSVYLNYLYMYVTPILMIILALMIISVTLVMIIL